MLLYMARGCPNCYGKIDDDRLKMGYVCENCLPQIKEEDKCLSLNREGKLLNLAKYCQSLEKVELFKDVFHRATGNQPSSLQINWAKRFFLGDSFAIVSPTGSGKSTFGQIISLIDEGKSLIILPTKLLVTQFYNKINNFSDKSGIDRKILRYSGKPDEKNRLQNGDFDIFICTTAFLHRNFDILSNLKFSYIFIDDVDSFLKSGKNVENLFKLIGFSDEDIKLGLRRDTSPEFYEKLDKLKEKITTKLVISSATLKPKTNRAILFQNLLGFEITRFLSTLRKIEDYHIPVAEKDGDIFSKLLEKSWEVAKNLGNGGIFFLEEEYGRESVEKVAEYLKDKGINAKSYLDDKEENLLAELTQGKIDVIVGLAHLTNPLLRGIDLPEVLRYAVFIGVPKTKLKIENLQDDHRKVYTILLALMPLMEEEEKLYITSKLNYLKRFLTVEREKIKQNQKAETLIQQLTDFLNEKLSNIEFIQKLSESDEVFLEIDDQNSLYIIFGNAQVYIQGSGRVSRLTSKGLLPGLSIILSDSQKALNSLRKRLKYYTTYEINIPEVNIEKLIDIDERIKEERQSLNQTFIDFKTKVVIVESPHKAKTIASFFGKPSIRRVGSSIVYEIPTENALLSVTASLGHIFDLSRKVGIYGVLEEENGYFPVFDSIKIDKNNSKQYIDDLPPNSESIVDKISIIHSLQRITFCCDEVYVASDPDAEGEKIAYDLMINLKPFQSNIRRLEFHEITKEEFERAMLSPQEINIYKVKAQLSRRVADRWVGFSLSRELWNAFNKNYLSAGRVQTPVLGWIIQRTNESKLSKYRVSFSIDKSTFHLELEDKNIAQALINSLDNLILSVVEKKVEEISPPPPYTTDTVLEDAFNILKFSSDYTMKLLQELFEMGLITYHRTDSTRVSETGRYTVAKPYITSKFGEDYFLPREWYSPGAHECIRPTKPWDLEEIKLRVAYNILSFKSPKDSYKLYQLIFGRFMASQSRKAKVEKAVVRFETPVHSWQTELTTDILENGYNVFYNNIKLVSIPQNTDIKVTDKTIIKIPKTQPYTQASLIQKMKIKKLGRPSTYAEIISTLINRRYVYQLKNGYLLATKLGTEVYEFLNSRFEDYVSEEFTRKLEIFMDEVESGERDYMDIFLELKPLISNR